MSNRALSSSDWTRLKRLRGARTSGYSYTSGGTTFAGDLTTNADISPPEPGQRPYSPALLIPREGAGTSRTLRPAGKWTDHVAARTGDFVTSQQAVAPDGTLLNGKVFYDTSVCSGCSGATVVLSTKVGLCRACTVGRAAITGYPGAPYAGPNPAIRGLSVFKNVIV